MKLKFKLIILLIALTSISAKAKEYTDTLHVGYINTKIDALDITNKFGTIEINDWGGDSVTIDVYITVESISKDNAKSMINLIDVEFYQSGSTVNAKTVIDETFKTTQNFSIDYIVNIPKSYNLNIDNKFGNLILNELTGTGNFDISYGNITAGVINSSSAVTLDLSYGKADMETINKLNAEVKYSKIYLVNTENLNIDSKYSGINIEVLKNLNLDSKYDDINIELADNITANSKYSNYDIEQLSGSIELDTEYGTVQIDKVSNSFNNIEIINSYGGINIGMNDISYRLNAECNYCDINYDASKFQGNREESNSNLIINGTFGNNPGNKLVKLDSKYGDIKLK